MNNHHFAIGISLALVTGTLSAQTQSFNDNVLGDNDDSDKDN